MGIKIIEKMWTDEIPAMANISEQIKRRLFRIRGEKDSKM